MAQYTSIQNTNPLHKALLGSVVAVLLTGCGGASPPPPPSSGADLSGTEMMAVRGDPYATRYLTPVQQQRVNAYRASHPEVTPTWGRDATNMAMGAGAGFLVGNMTSAARTGTALTAAEAVAPEVVAPAVERVAVRTALVPAVEAAESDAVITGVVERAGLAELLELLLIF